MDWGIGELLLYTLIFGKRCVKKTRLEGGEACISCGTYCVNFLARTFREGGNEGGGNDCAFVHKETTYRFAYCIFTLRGGRGVLGVQYLLSDAFDRASIKVEIRLSCLCFFSKIEDRKNLIIFFFAADERSCLGNSAMMLIYYHTEYKM